MFLKRFADAKPYEAPNHHDVRSLRLQGFDPESSKNYWIGLSHYLPGGGAGPDITPFEKSYVVLSGELTLIVGGKETVLGPLDSCTVPAGEQREIVNRSNQVCTIIAVLQYPPVKP
jgi:mannose-6-phosphate isomerase-like protein (cupin superfamily)